MIQVIRYPNRKLYIPKKQIDGKGRYVTIRELFYLGEPFKITVAESGEDITKSIVTNALFVYKDLRDAFFKEWSVERIVRFVRKNDPKKLP